MLCANLRNVATLSSKLKCMQVFEWIAPHVSDDCIFNRIAPFII
jgi:hypothetical protein